MSDHETSSAGGTGQEARAASGVGGDEQFEDDRDRYCIPAGITLLPETEAWLALARRDHATALDILKAEEMAAKLAARAAGSVTETEPEAGQ